jgi:hypothetical protein
VVPGLAAEVEDGERGVVATFRASPRSVGTGLSPFASFQIDASTVVETFGTDKVKEVVLVFELDYRGIDPAVGVAVKPCRPDLP